jgi:hypothetical protein
VIAQLLKSINDFVVISALGLLPALLTAEMAKNDTQNTENGPKMSENDSKMAENDIKNTENGSKMIENGSKMAENGEIWVIFRSLMLISHKKLVQEAVFRCFWRISAENGGFLCLFEGCGPFFARFFYENTENEAKMTENGAKMTENGAKMTENGPKTTENGPKTLKNGEKAVEMSENARISLLNALGLLFKFPEKWASRDDIFSILNAMGLCFFFLN